MDTLAQYSPMEVDDQGIQSAVGPTTPDAAAYPVDPQWFGLVKQLKPDNRREHHVRFLYPGRISRVNPHTAVPMTPKSRSRTISPSPQYCETVDMLRFLFSFCNTRGNASEVEYKDKEFKFAFDEVQKLASTKKSPLTEHLDQA